jgi:SAM-dependent methyltransferase
MEDADQLVTRLCLEKLGGLKVGNIRLLNQGRRIRNSYDLQIAILGCDLLLSPAASTSSYQHIEKMSIRSALDLNEARCGACISLLIQHFIDIERLDPGVLFFELPPELADSNVGLERRSPDELWQLASGNYRLLVSGQTGGDGLDLRKAILDPHVTSLLLRLVDDSTSFLDVGCGNGSLVDFLAPVVRRACGADIGIADDGISFFCSSIYELGSVFPENTFDVVLVNLVIQWIERLDAAIAELNRVMRLGGHLVITLPTPTVTHTGYWQKTEKGYVFHVTERIPERKLVMLNRMVGPLWYFGRSLSELVTAFAAKGFVLSGSEELYAGDYGSTPTELLRKRPSLRRYVIVPPFTTLHFVLAKK